MMAMTTRSSISVNPLTLFDARMTNLAARNPQT
jgi:hypothetical protein